MSSGASSSLPTFKSVSSRIQELETIENSKQTSGITDEGDPLVRSVSRKDEEPQSFYGILHYVAAFSLIALIGKAVYVSKWDDVRVSESKSSLSTAFVYLAASGDKDISNLRFSLEHLDKAYNSNAGHRVVILHDSLNSSVQNLVQNDFPTHLEFREVNLELPKELREKYNLSALTPAFSKRGKWNYQNMCRFWFSVITGKQSPLSDVDVMVRLDTDSAFSQGLIERDFVADFIGGSRRYGYTKMEKECDVDDKGSAQTLKAMLLQYVKINAIVPKSVDLWNKVLQQEKTKCLSKFENSFEILDLKFWRSHPGVQDWRAVVEKNGGIYRNGWGDGQLRYATVAMHVRQEELVQISKRRLMYRHPHNSEETAVVGRKGS